MVPTSTKCKRGARAGWNLHNPEFKEKESYPIQESSKGKRSLSSGIGGRPSPLRRSTTKEGGTHWERMACGQWRGLLGRRPAPPPRAVPQAEDRQHAEGKTTTEACTLPQDGVHHLPAPSPLSCFIWSGKGKEPQMAAAVLLANSDGS